MKNLFYILICIIIIIYFLFSPADALDASKTGLLLWFEQILPTLLPFSIISNLLICSNLFSAIRRKFSLPFSPEKAFTILCGFLFGFPIGSKLTADFYKQGALCESDARILCCFTNNLSPVFISGYVCTSMLHRPDWILPIYLTLFVPSLAYGLIMLLFTRKKMLPDKAHTKKPASAFCINMQLLDTGIIHSFLTMIKLCGYIMLFSILARFLMQIPQLSATVKIFLTCSLEITNGIALLTNAPLNEHMLYVCTVAFLSFGGISGIAQTGSMLSGTNLKLKDYVIQRVLLTILCTACAIIYRLFLSVIL